MRTTSRAGFDRRLALLVAATSFMEFLDGTVVQTAAPAMARDFHVQAADLNVTMTVYLLAVAVCIPASGWLGERYGVRRVYVAAIALFTLSSVLCALAPGLLALCIVRALQGVSGAMMVPVGRLAVLRAVPASRLLEAVAYLTWPALLAPVIAPAVGGILTDAAGWRWIFVINLPLGVAAVLAALRLVPEAEELRPPPLDWPGLLLIAGALAAVVEVGELGAGTATDWPAVGVAVTAAAAACWLARRRLLAARHPLLDLAALSVPTFRVGNLGGGVYRLVISAVPFLVTLLLQAGFGWSATRAGLTVIALFVGNLAIKPVTSPLIRRLGFRAVLLGANASGAAILMLVVLVGPGTPTPAIAALLLASGAARSIGFSAYNTLQFVDIPPGLTSGANTLSATMQQVVTGLGIAVAAVLVRVGSALAGHLSAEPALGYRVAFVGAAALLVVPLVEALRLRADAGRAALSMR